MAVYSQCRNIEIDASELSSPSSTLPDFIQQQLKEYAPKCIEEVNGLLEGIRSTWTGWSVLSTIAKLTSKKMVIKPWKKIDKNTLSFEQNATAGPANMVDATPQDKMLLACADDPSTNSRANQPLTGTNGDVYRGTGQGSNTEVRFTSEMWPGGGSSTAGPGAEGSEILFHEMVHGLRQMRGVMQCASTTMNRNFDTREEFMAILVSNMYRSELHRNGLRADHHGFQPLPVAMQDASAFLSTYLDYVQQLVEEDRALAMLLKNVNCEFNPVKAFYDRYPRIFAGGK